MKKIKQKTKQEILEAYIDYVLDHEKRPSSSYKFAKSIEIDESSFYKSFGSVDQIEAYFWHELISKSKELYDKSVEEDLDIENKILSFYFILFENLTLNRSFVLQLSNCKNSFGPIEGDLRKALKPILADFSLEFETMLHSLNQEVGEKVTEAALWVQFMTIYNFWKKDRSTEFEDTDAFIEKSIRLSSELSKSLPIESILDYGKFVMKSFSGRV